MMGPEYLHWPFFDDSHRALAEQAEAWAQRHCAHIDHDDVDKACIGLVAELGKAGLLAHTVTQPYGGALDRFDVRSLCVMRETLARHAGLADFAFAMQGLGSGPIVLFGTDEQKREFLPPVAAGKSLAAFALSEPDAGSDVAALATTAVRDGDDFILNGVKTWISNGGIAAHYVVFARTGEGEGTRGLSAFIVPHDTQGLKVGGRIDVIAPHPLSALEFDDCRVPARYLVGQPGAGFKIAMATLDVFRSTVGAAALGFAKRAYLETLEFVKNRYISGRPLADYQLTQAKIADMATAIDAAALLIYRAAWTKDMGAERVTREASMAKLFATEEAQKVIDQAVQLHGGLGVKTGSKVEELYREIRALRIYEGASEVQKLVIARQVLR